MPNNTAPHYYAYAKKAFVHPSKLHVSKNSNVLYDRPLLKEIKTTFFLNEYFLSGDQIFTFKNKISTGKYFSIEKSIFLICYLECPTGIKELSTETNIRYDLNKTLMGFRNPIRNFYFLLENNLS